MGSLGVDWTAVEGEMCLVFGCRGVGQAVGFEGVGVGGVLEGDVVAVDVQLPGTVVVAAVVAPAEKHGIVR